ncbi:MAG: tetraacyldisaccharide 4'-kinase [Thermoanaerobaculia bacterium]
MTRFLKPVELLWRGVNRLRRALYRRGILKSKRLPRPVISVGNLSAGGAGKTPTVIAIARYLDKRGFRVAVLTRGYGRSGNDAGLVTSSDAARFGDEPVLIKSKLKNVDVIVGSKRYENAIQFLSENDCDLFVLDDGFQHLQLARDVDVVIDATGTVMREGQSALAGADFVIQRDLRLVVPEGLMNRPILAFAGLADNEQFFDSLRVLGLNVVGTKGFKDHHRYTPGDIAELKQAAGTAALVTTEKDVVKIDDRDIIAIAAEMIVQPAVLEAIAARISR